MGIAKDSIESLKLKARISDFVLASTSGKLRGNKGMAICPFHGEKTASMSFTDEENLFHCFVFYLFLILISERHASIF